MGNIVWLASYPKSGTTWLRAFLHNFLRPSEQPYDINRLSDFTANECEASLYQAHDPRPASQYSMAEVQRLRPLVHRDLARLMPELVFVKTHNAVLLVEGKPLLTPEVTAGSIYIVRDPRAVALSYSRHLGWSIDDTIEFMTNDGAAAGGDDRHVFERLASWSSHVLSWTQRSNPRLHILRYEDMLADPHTAFGSIIRFLGREPPAERLDRAIGFSRFELLQDQESRSGFVERPAGAAAFFQTGRADAWREALTPDQAKRIAARHGEQMRRFGYL
ncbi:MAG: sulfotransferase domain-containing protein [Aliidongia sp.]